VLFLKKKEAKVVCVCIYIYKLQLNALAQGVPKRLGTIKVQQSCTKPTRRKTRKRKRKNKLE